MPSCLWRYAATDRHHHHHFLCLHHLAQRARAHSARARALHSALAHTLLFNGGVHHHAMRARATSSYQITEKALFVVMAARAVNEYTRQKSANHVMAAQQRARIYRVSHHRMTRASPRCRDARAPPEMRRFSSPAYRYIEIILPCQRDIINCRENEHQHQYINSFCSDQRTEFLAALNTSMPCYLTY